MNIQTKSLTVNNGRNASLTDFRVETDTAESLCETITLSLLILFRDFILSRNKPRYLFGWGNIPGSDSDRLLKFLKYDLDIDHIENAIIIKTNEDKNILISTEEKSVEISLNEKMDKIILNISNGRIYNLIAKEENGQLKIYESGRYKTQLNKIAGYVTTLFGTKEQSEKVILYSFGTYLMNFEATLRHLEAQNLIKIEDNKPVITEEGLSWIAKKLLQGEENGIYSRPIMDKIISQIDTCLFTDISTLIEKTLSSDRKWDFKKSVVNGKNIISMNDWSRYGTGMIHSYIYTLLYSYSKLENHFKNKWKENELDVCPIDYSKIPSIVPSIELQRKQNFRNIPLTTIFEKSLPSAVNEEKVEGKNYISNMWYIVEGVNIIHALSGMVPTIEDIAILCLANYKHAVFYDKIDQVGQKKMRESLIRYDINKLSDYGILLKDKYNKKYRYKLAAKCFHDTILDRKFQVVDEIMLQNEYKNKIKIYDDVRF